MRCVASRSSPTERHRPTRGTPLRRSGPGPRSDRRDAAVSRCRKGTDAQTRQAPGHPDRHRHGLHPADGAPYAAGTGLACESADTSLATRLLRAGPSASGPADGGLRSPLNYYARQPGPDAPTAQAHVTTGSATATITMTTAVPTAIRQRDPHSGRRAAVPWFRSIFCPHPGTGLILKARIGFRPHVLCAFALFAFWSSSPAGRGREVVSRQ